MEQLILNGKVCFTKFNDKLYALNGAQGGEPNVYYEPQNFIIANPILGSKTVRIRQKDGSSNVEGLDGILVGLTIADYLSDRVCSGGLYRLIYQTAGLLADNISSLNCSQINGRVAQIWTAESDSLARSAQEIIRDVYEGQPFKIVTQDFIEKVGVLPAAQTGQTNTLLNLIEAHQYILAQFYNEIGLPSNWNMKRERVNTAETELMQGSLDISIYSMENCLKTAVEKVNELFGTSISVRFNEEVIEEEGNALEEEPEALNDTLPTEEKAEAPQEEVEEEVKEEEVKVETKEKEGDE